MYIDVGAAVLIGETREFPKSNMDLKTTNAAQVKNLPPSPGVGQNLPFFV